ncbi:Drimenol cyclase drtB [Exophiala dermatitidis]
MAACISADREANQAQGLSDVEVPAGRQAAASQEEEPRCKTRLPEEHLNAEQLKLMESGMPLTALPPHSNHVGLPNGLKETNQTCPMAEQRESINGSSAAEDKIGISNSDQPTTNGQAKKYPKIPGIIFDIGDVLCNWTAPESLPVGPAMLHRFRKTRFWYDYDLGMISQDECYGQLSKQYDVAEADIAEAFDKARESLSPNGAVFDIIRAIKDTYREAIKVYLMSNIPAAEWQALKEDTRFEWSLFDGFYTSSAVGMCKPELRFYRHVLQQTGLKPSEVVLVDDNGENVLAARSLGIKSLRFTGALGLNQFLKNVFDDPIERGLAFLNNNAKEMSVGDIDLVTLTFYDWTWNYYIEKPIDTVEKFPDDIDTTALAIVLLCNDVKKANDIMDEILRYTNADGIIMTYFDNKRPRVDPAVCVNALRLFYKFSRGDLPALQPSKDWVSDVLFHRAYLDGTYYYPTADVFLFLFSHLLNANPESDMYRRTASLLRERLQERIGANGDALELSMRVIACLNMGIKDEVDLRKIEASQQEDGGWEIGWLCQTGKTSLKIGNRGLTTALAVKAIEMGRKRG